MYWWCQEKIDVGHSWDLKGYTLQNSRVFFLKISKEIGKAWRKGLTRARRASLTFSLVPDLLFDLSRILE